MTGPDPSLFEIPPYPKELASIPTLQDVVDPTPARLLMARRWIAKVRVGEDGCLIWTASFKRLIPQKSYGAFEFRESPEAKPVCHMAHRAAHQLFVGPIADGLTIDHLCRNGMCVNPKHLEAVSMRTNTLRGTSPVAESARKTHCILGHEFSGANVYIPPSYPTQRICRECKRIRDRKRRQK